MSGIIEQSWVVNVERKILDDKSKISLYVGDKNSHLVEFVFYRNDKEFIPEKLTSYFVRRDGETVLLNGEQTGNRYTTNFSSACYSLPGWHYLFVRCQQDEQNITTVAKIRFLVKENSGEEDPPCYDPRLDELNDAIDKSNRLVSDIEKKLNNGEFDGTDGLTPHIGENGNWFVGETDTGTQAQGPMPDLTNIEDSLTELTKEIDKLKALGLSVVDGKICQTYSGEE